jgi:hypothetical protein
MKTKAVDLNWNEVKVAARNRDRWLCLVDGLCSKYRKHWLIDNSPARTGELNHHYSQSPTRVEGIHSTGCCPVPRRDRSRHCYHHLVAMQPSAQYLAPLFRWSRALFAVLDVTPSPRRGRPGLDLGGVLRGYKNCEASLYAYAVVSTLMSLVPSLAQVFSLAPSSHIGLLSVRVFPVTRESAFTTLQNLCGNVKDCALDGGNNFRIHSKLFSFGLLLLFPNILSLPHLLRGSSWMFWVFRWGSASVV